MPRGPLSLRVVGEVILLEAIVFYTVLFYMLPRNCVSMRAVATRTMGSGFVLMVSTKRNKRSSNTVNQVSHRGAVGLSITGTFNGLIRRRYSSIGIICAHGDSIFIPLKGQTRVTGGTSTSLFISVRAGTLPKGGIKQKTRACALNVTQTSSGLRITGHRGSIVLIRRSCGRHCRKFSPGSSRDCVVFRLVRSRCVTRDISFTQRVRARFQAATEEGSGKIRRTNFLMLHRADVPDILMRLKCVSARSRRGFLYSRGNVSGVDHDVCGTFYGCYGRRHGDKDEGIVTSGSNIQRTSAGIPMSSGITSPGTGSGRRGGIGNDGSTRVMFGVRLVTSSHRVPTKDDHFGKLSPISICGRGNVCGCACNRAGDCGRTIHVQSGVGGSFRKLFVITFGGKGGVGLRRTVARSGRGGWALGSL